MIRWLPHPTPHTTRAPRRYPTIRWHPRGHRPPPAARARPPGAAAAAAPDPRAPPVTGAQLAELDRRVDRERELSPLGAGPARLHRARPGAGPTRRHKPWRTTYESIGCIVGEPGSSPLADRRGRDPGLAALRDPAPAGRLLRRARPDSPGPGATVGTFQLTDLVLTAPEVDQLADGGGCRPRPATAAHRDRRGRPRPASRCRSSPSPPPRLRPGRPRNSMDDPMRLLSGPLRTAGSGCWSPARPCRWSATASTPSRWPSLPCSTAARRPPTLAMVAGRRSRAAGRLRPARRGARRPGQPRGLILLGLRPRAAGRRDRARRCCCSTAHAAAVVLLVACVVPLGAASGAAAPAFSAILPDLVDADRPGARQLG